VALAPEELTMPRRDPVVTTDPNFTPTAVDHPPAAPAAPTDREIARAMAVPVQVVGDDLSPIPWLGQRVHFLGQGASECLAGMIIRIIPPAPGLPDTDRCELTVFSPVTPHPVFVTAERDETGRGYSTWHRIHP